MGCYDHGKTQTLVAVLVDNHEDGWGTEVIVGQRIRVGSSRVRICDVAVLEAGAPREQVTATPPLLCIEILSPKDRLPRAELVLADYFAMSVPNIWLIDPYKRLAYTFGPTGLHPADPTNLTVPATPVRIDSPPS